MKSNQDNLTTLQEIGITVERVRDWLPEKLRRRVDVTAAWQRVKIHFCAALVGRGVCPETCELCREHIISIFDIQEERVKIRDIEALLTYRARDESARAIEALIAAEKRSARSFLATSTREQAIAALFHREDENPFLALLESIRRERGER